MDFLLVGYGAAGGVVVAAAAAKLEFEIVGGKDTNRVEIGIRRRQSVRHNSRGMQIVDNTLEYVDSTVVDSEVASSGISRNLFQDCGSV
jgi:hypothetical protein